MPYTERPDVAFAGARAVNDAVYGETVLEVPDRFGVKSIAIYIFNIAHREFNVPRPPNHPHLFLRACPHDQEFLLVGQIEHPFTEFAEDSNQNRIPHFTDGYREASRMLNPMNPGTDQDFAIESPYHFGLNLNRFGVFWSENNPPLKEELQAAKRRMEISYRAELERMTKAKTKDEAREMANDISHAAAEHFGLSFSWHQSDLDAKNKDAGKVDCWACGEKIQPHALICVHCRAPQAEEKRDRWLEAQTSPGRKSA